ncbi:uncharacterized protein [Mytilus edulis]|uniref:uncharacterized protein n=1 Tax=Mytilus edulis TaxID=6550 RepID=UPI0039EEB8C8
MRMTEMPQDCLVRESERPYKSTLDKPFKDTQFNILTSLDEFDETSKNSTKPVMCMYCYNKFNQVSQRGHVTNSIDNELHNLSQFEHDIIEQNNTTESTPFKSFAIGSYDNIDKNQVHSSVKAGKSNSGFHGTSVQSVEPLPETLLHSVTNSSSENSILETTDPLTTLLNSSSTSEMSTSSREILTLSSEILTSSEFFTSSNVIPTSSSVISTSNTEISTKCIQQGENTNSISSSCDSSPVKNDILDTIPNLDNSHYKKYSETSHIR